MIIPFATPRDGEIYNMSQVVRCKQVSSDECLVTFADGETRIFKDKAAHIMHAEFMFHVTNYRMFGNAVAEAAKQERSLIVPPDFSNGRPN